MNKKFMTLGLAAAVGLAGLVALPVLASSFTGTTTWTGTTEMVDGMYDVTKTFKYDGKVTIDGTELALDKLTDYVKGTDEVAGTPNADLDTAKGTPTIAATPAHEKLTMVGTLADVVKTFTKLATDIDTDQEKEDLAGLKELTVELKDVASTLAVTEAQVTQVKNLSKDLKNLKKIAFKLDPRVTVLNLDGVKYTTVKDLKGIVSFSAVEGIENVDHSKAKEILAALGANFTKWGKDSKNNDIAAVAPQTQPQAQQPQTSQEAQNAGNTQGAAPQTTPKTPNTGIAE